MNLYVRAMANAIMNGSCLQFYISFFVASNHILFHVEIDSKLIERGETVACWTRLPVLVMPCIHGAIVVATGRRDSCADRLPVVFTVYTRRLSRRRPVAPTIAARYRWSNCRAGGGTYKMRRAKMRKCENGQRIKCELKCEVLFAFLPPNAI